MRFTPMAVLICFLSTAVTAGPFDGFWGGTGECDPTREEGISIFDKISECLVLLLFGGCMEKRELRKGERNEKMIILMKTKFN